MTREPITLGADRITGRGGTLNPFLILKDAAGFITFAEDVFDGEEVARARTPTPDGLLIHAEVRVGNSLLLLADPQEGWRPRPGMLQVWTSDAEKLASRAVDRAATIVTPPTPFYGSVTLARIEDPWGNLWWVYQPVPGQPDPKPAWEGGSDIVFRTLDEHLRFDRS
ncbi:VOC family protein [Spelaeicoccus albus]|uniref:Putative glyoxalase superfamily protein PhnB n=1 Tax=Spelaeicoccus albus TaxID=1280376 RepID=A0A7Z0IJ73_9MICO|nr:VOC family protein [Spelaeicoccus albus]NYI69127.1 putative glyoxalase superfamily protein PhnB [Spelaeicoccus albus]